MIIHYSLSPTEDLEALREAERTLDILELTDIPYDIDVYSSNDMREGRGGLFKECNEGLLERLMIADYQSNKYNVQNEPEGVKQEIEYRLGLKEKPKSKANNNDADEELIKRVCRRMGVTYKTGMSQQQVTAAIRKKHPRMSDYEIGMLMYSFLQDETQKMIADGLMSSAISSNSNDANRANNYIEQLKNDHSNDFENIKCKRVDNVTFDINYARKYIVRVNYYSTGPYEKGINIMLP